jgi:hypothetical protein
MIVGSNPGAKIVNRILTNLGARQFPVVRRRGDERQGDGKPGVDVMIFKAFIPD